MANTKLKKVQINDTTYEICDWYGESSTASTTQNKAVTISGFTSDSVMDGVVISVYFSNSQKYNGMPRLSIGSIGTYDIRYNNTDYAGIDAWKAGEVVNFVFRNGNLYMDRRDYLTLSDLPLYDGTVV